MKSFRDNNAHEVTLTSPENYTSLQDALAKSNRDPNIVPTWTPDGFILEKVEKDATPRQEVYRAFYLCDDEELVIQIQSYLDYNPEKIEINEDLVEIYESGGIEYYILSNNKQLQAIWKTNSYECRIAGDLSIDELTQMIDSIGKG